MNPRAVLSRRLLVACGLAVLLVALGSAIALAAGGQAPPPPKPLAVAVRDAVKAPQVPGVTARIKFTNDLIDSSSLRGSDPILSGATGRLWISRDHVRLELQSDSGDAQIVSDGKIVSVYDARSNTAYTARLPRERRAHRHHERRGPPSLATIQKGINRLMRRAELSGARPSVVGDRPAYTVRVSPKRDGGRVAAAELAWDAVRGVPLRGAVYAKGESKPVLELEATDISFGPVAASTFDVKPPARANTVALGGPERGKHSSRRRLPFSPSAPERLSGLRRTGVRRVDHRGQPGALVTYGRGLGGIAVIEQPAARSRRPERVRGLDLPNVSIKGATGQELRTALGTVVRFTRGGVSYTVLGSVSPGAAEAAARGL